MCVLYPLLVFLAAIKGMSHRHLFQEIKKCEFYNTVELEHSWWLSYAKSALTVLCFMPQLEVRLPKGEVCIDLYLFVFTYTYKRIIRSGR